VWLLVDFWAAKYWMSVLLSLAHVAAVLAWSQMYMELHLAQEAILHIDWARIDSIVWLQMVA